MNHTEDRLRQALRRTAERADTLTGAPFEGVRSRARGIRRRRHTALAAVAAAAVAAITVPTALALQGDPDSARQPADQGTQLPTPTPSQLPSPTPTAAPSRSPSGQATPQDTLASVPRGPDTFLAYVGPDGRVHDNGSTTALPGGTKLLTTFAEYRGDWVVQRDLTITDYAPSGSVVRSGRAGNIVLSADRTQIAYQVGDTVYLSSRSTMGNGGAQPLPAPHGSTLIGFLQEGPVVAEGPHRLVTLGAAPTTYPLPLLPTVVSQADDLVGGITGTVAKGDLEGAVSDLRGTLLWHGSWRPLRFSDDGRYVAAAPVADNGDPERFAILDARTGMQVAVSPRFGSGTSLDWNVAWDGDRMVFGAVGDEGHALLALDTSGRLTRVTDVATVPAGQVGYLLGAQP